MIYSINYMDMARKINPLALAIYLKETGWQQFNTKRDDIKIFQYDNGKIFEQINVPLTKELSDFNLAMYKSVEKLAKVENKSIEQVMLFLLNPNTDIIKIRLDKRGVESGNILLDDAIKIYENAKKLLAATALDIVNPKIYHQGRVDEVVQKFLADCRFGQTEIGSYVVSVVCPFAELSQSNGYKQLSIFSDEERCANSLTRNVTNKLLENIRIIKNKIDEGDYTDLVNKENTYKISANFYEALKGLNLEGQDTLLEFKAEWSPVVKANQYRFSSVTIDNNYYDPIVSIIEKLKDDIDQASEIVGRVKKLEAAPGVDKRTTGKITISYINEDNKSRVISTELQKSDYDKAIEAHQQGKYVKVLGTLINKSKPTLECHSFSIIE